MSKDNDMRIESYDGRDAFYSGTDEDYEEFLKSVGADDGEKIQENAEPVENTQKINLSETINLQGVIDKFKKKAEDIGHGARMVKESVKEVIRAKREEEAQRMGRGLDESDFFTAENLKSNPKQTPDNKGEETAESGFGKIIRESVKESEKKVDRFKKDVDAISAVPGKVGDIENSVAGIGEGVAALAAKVSSLDDKISMLEAAVNDAKKENNEAVKSAVKENTETIQDGINSVKDEITEIRQSITSVSRLNDSVFDLKNTQLNTKNSISNLELAFSRLKKKCVLGVTVLSILSAVIIALEIILMLS